MGACGGAGAERSEQPIERQFRCRGGRGWGWGGRRGSARARPGRSAAAGERAREAGAAPPAVLSLGAAAAAARGAGTRCGGSRAAWRSRSVSRWRGGRAPGGRVPGPSRRSRPPPRSSSLARWRGGREGHARAARPGLGCRLAAPPALLPGLSSRIGVLARGRASSLYLPCAPGTGRPRPPLPDDVSPRCTWVETEDEPRACAVCVCGEPSRLQPEARASTAPLCTRGAWAPRTLGKPAWEEPR